jgi:hypothetical protein
MELDVCKKVNIQIKMCFVSCLFPEDVLEEENAISKSKEEQVEKLPTGHIVGIIRRKWRQYCGILQKNPIEGVSSVSNYWSH